MNIHVWNHEDDAKLKQAQEEITQMKENQALSTAKIDALGERGDFIEDCIAEMAERIYK